jgi:hypothetical protein
VNYKLSSQLNEKTLKAGGSCNQGIFKLNQCPRLESNQQPSASEANALSN